MKKLISLLLAVLMLCSLCLGASALENSLLLHAYYVCSDEYLMVPGAPLPAKAELSVAIDGEAVEASVLTMKEMEAGTTFYCVVGLSSNMSEQAKERQLGVLTELSAIMGEKDSMVILAVGDGMQEIGPLTNSKDRKAAIESLKYTVPSIDLYKAVSKGLDSLMGNPEYNFNKCMIVLSDGKDSGKDNITEKSVLELIAQTTVPVFGVGCLPDDPGDYSRSVAEGLKNMMLVTVGGGFYETSAKGNKPAGIAQGIYDTMQAASVVLVHASDLAANSRGDTFILTLYCKDGKDVFEDSVVIPNEDMPAYKSSGVKTAGTPALPGPVAQEKEFPWVAVILGVVAALAVIATVVIIVLKNKKPKETPYSGMPQDISATGPVSEPFGATGPVDGISPPGPFDLGGTDFATEPMTPAGPSMHVLLTVIGHKDQSFSFDLGLDQPAVLGRDDRADIALKINGQGDPKMSGRHCTLQWSKGKLFVADNNSTNGTFVNGARVVPGSLQQLENGATIKMGGREYRVSFQA